MFLQVYKYIFNYLTGGVSWSRYSNTGYRLEEYLKLLKSQADVNNVLNVMIMPVASKKRQYPGSDDKPCDTNNDIDSIPLPTDKTNNNNNNNNFDNFTPISVYDAPELILAKLVRM